MNFFEMVVEVTEEATKEKQMKEYAKLRTEFDSMIMRVARDGKHELFVEVEVNEDTPYMFRAYQDLIDDYTSMGFSVDVMEDDRMGEANIHSIKIRWDKNYLENKGK